MSLTFILKALDQGLVDAWAEAFADIPEVQPSQGNILAESADAIVSPANSFGVMDGGIDLVYSKFFGWDLEKRLSDRLFAEWDGELPVGNALIVPTNHEQIAWLISAPTMRVPMRIERTANAHLAFKAVIRATLAFNAAAEAPIKTVLCPGLGTGEGRMPYDRCATQMRYAYEATIGGRPVRKGGLAGAVRNHLALIGEDNSF